jgi:hypothetical protein
VTRHREQRARAGSKRKLAMASFSEQGGTCVVQKREGEQPTLRTREMWGTWLKMASGQVQSVRGLENVRETWSSDSTYEGVTEEIGLPNQSCIYKPLYTLSVTIL